MVRYFQSRIFQGVAGPPKRGGRKIGRFSARPTRQLRGGIFGRWYDRKISRRPLSLIVIIKSRKNVPIYENNRSILHFSCLGAIFRSDWRGSVQCSRTVRLPLSFLTDPRHKRAVPLFPGGTALPPAKNAKTCLPIYWSDKPCLLLCGTRREV